MAEAHAAALRALADSDVSFLSASELGMSSMLTGQALPLPPMASLPLPVSAPSTLPPVPVTPVRAVPAAAVFHPLSNL